DPAELLASYDVQESGLSQLGRVAYHTLGLHSYLTAGPKEIRAWTIKQGATAPQAAGVIHTDFEKGFIHAQVVDYDDLVTAGSEQADKAAGKIRTEGRDYVMRPEDVVEFRFNVYIISSYFEVFFKPRRTGALVTSLYSAIRLARDRPPLPEGV